jgi:peptide deformylase
VSTHPAVAAWTEADLDVVGRVRDVVRAPDRVLSTDGDRVDPTAPETVQLAADLVATMRVSPGCVGLAAPQVGEGVKVFCVDVSGHPKTRDHHGTFVLCNAEVVESSRNEKAREGCMSVPDLTGDVKRAGRVVVRGQLPAPARRSCSRPTPSRPVPSSTRSTTATACSSSTAPPAPTRSTLARPTCSAPVSQSAEEAVLKTAQSGFESQPGHLVVRRGNTPARSRV